jgi:hypothetical protein
VLAQLRTRMIRLNGSCIELERRNQTSADAAGQVKQLSTFCSGALSGTHSGHSCYNRQAKEAGISPFAWEAGQHLMERNGRQTWSRSTRRIMMYVRRYRGRQRGGRKRESSCCGRTLTSISNMHLCITSSLPTTYNSLFLCTP